MAGKRHVGKKHRGGKKSKHHTKIVPEHMLGKSLKKHGGKKGSKRGGRRK